MHWPCVIVMCMSTCFQYVALCCVVSIDQVQVVNQPGTARHSLHQEQPNTENFLQSTRSMAAGAPVLLLTAQQTVTLPDKPANVLLILLPSCWLPADGQVTQAACAAAPTTPSIVNHCQGCAGQLPRASDTAAYAHARPPKGLLRVVVLLLLHCTPRFNLSPVAAAVARFAHAAAMRSCPACLMRSSISCLQQQQDRSRGQRSAQSSRV